MAFCVTLCSCLNPTGSYATDLHMLMTHVTAFLATCSGHCSDSPAELGALWHLGLVSLPTVGLCPHFWLDWLYSL